MNTATEYPAPPNLNRTTAMTYHQSPFPSMVACRQTMEAAQRDQRNGTAMNKNWETTAHALRTELAAKETKLERMQRLHDTWANSDADAPVYPLWKALGVILSGQLTLPCDVCDGAGTVKCWNPGGPCPRPNDPECTVCGPCRTCGGS